MPVTVITFGTFDLFHIGHLSILERAAALGDRLVVGVSSDALNLKKKGQVPVYGETDRMRIVAALRFVDEVFLEESLEEKEDYIRKMKADILVMGSDWRSVFDDMPCRVIYLARTEGISSTLVKRKIKSSVITLF